MLASNAPLERSPRTHALNARIKCSLRTLGSNGCFECSLRILSSNARIECSLQMLASNARFKWLPQMLASNVRFKYSLFLCTTRVGNSAHLSHVIQQNKQSRLTNHSPANVTCYNEEFNAAIKRCNFKEGGVTQSPETLAAAGRSGPHRAALRPARVAGIHNIHQELGDLRLDGRCPSSRPRSVAFRGTARFGAGSAHYASAFVLLPRYTVAARKEFTIGSNRWKLRGQIRPARALPTSG